MRTIEYVDQGITFTASTGSFVSASLKVDNRFINAEDVKYTFEFVPENSFSNRGVL